MGTSAPSAMKDDIEQGPREDTKEASSHKLIKYTALVLLVVQNASVIILTRVIKQSNGAPFLATVAVLTAEIIKFALCGSVLLYQNKHAVLNPCGTARALLAQHGAATLKGGEPALWYTVQNYLVYFSLANLEIVVFQLMYQSKLLIAAPFSILILKKQLSAQNWLALLALFTGLVIVNLSSEDAPATPGVVKNFSLGCLGALLGSSLSAFAGVYFEALLKGASVSLWARNVQLCLFTVPLSLISAYLEGSAHPAIGPPTEPVITGWAGSLHTHGYLAGFTPTVWFVVLLQACGGMLVAVCLKYADNIIKNFASSVAIILGGLVSVVVFNFPLTLGFFVGGIIVLVAVPAYDPKLCPCISDKLDSKDSEAELLVQAPVHDQILTSLGITNLEEK